MKTIAVISDTHGNLNAIDKILPILESCDMVFHLGDGASDMRAYKSILEDKLVCVNGNCDFSSQDKWKLVEVEGKRLLLTHGDVFGVKGSLTRLKLFAEEKGANAVFYGHTHVAYKEEVDGILFVNPGSLARMCIDKSFAFVTIVNGKILCNHNRNAFV